MEIEGKVTFCEWCEAECSLPEWEAQQAGWFHLLCDKGRFTFCGLECLVAWL